MSIQQRRETAVSQAAQAGTVPASPGAHGAAARGQEGDSVRAAHPPAEYTAP